jgi:hypothetical protein
MSSTDDNAGFAEELPGKAADLIDEFVDRVHKKVVRPIIIAARAIVFGLLMVSVALLAIVVAAVGSIRLLNVYLFHGHEWVSYAIIGAVLFATGLTVFNKHHRDVEGGLRD